MGLFHEDEHVVQVLGFDDGHGASGAGAVPKMYMEKLEGKSLKEVRADWTEVRNVPEALFWRRKVFNAHKAMQRQRMRMKP